MTTLAERSAHDLGYVGAPHSRATVTTANGELLAIPDAWDNRFVDFHAEGVDVWIRFGDSGVQIDRTAVSTIDGSGVLTDVAKVAHLHILAGTTCPVLVRKGATMAATGEATQTHLAHISIATTGYLRMVLSTGPGEP